MSGIDASRERLSELASRQLCIYIDGREHRQVLGTVSGETFQALDNVLNLVQELREESREPEESRVEVNGRLVPYPPGAAYKDALAAAADRIEAVVFLALGR